MHVGRLRVRDLAVVALVGLGCTGTVAQDPAPVQQPINHTTTRTMKVSIWSDVMCPFCYIGKREFDNALARFPNKENIVIEWKSFQLDPSAPKRSEEDMYTMLAKKYGKSRDEAKGMVQGVVDRAKTVGLHYDMDRAVMANSYDAHRLSQLAKTVGKGHALEELLFQAQFLNGVDISDHAELEKMGAQVGLDPAAVKALWTSDAYGDAVRADIAEAQRIGVRGVPFFVIDDKYAVSGAQASDHFLGALTQAWSERPAPVLQEVGGGDAAAVCDPATGACVEPGHQH